VDDIRANLVLELLASNRAEALEYLRGVQSKIDILLELEAKQKG